MLVMSLVFIALCIWAALDMRKDGDFRHILLLPGAGIFAFLSLVLTRRLFSKHPVLVVEPAGLILPHRSAQLLPWAAVQGLEMVQSGKTKCMSIRIDPSFAKSTRRLRAGALLTRVFRPSQSKIAVNLSALKGDANSIFKRCSEAAKRDREARYAASNLNGMPPPDFLNPVEAPALKKGHPIFTYGLILFLILVYCCELAFGVDPPEAGSPSIRTLFLLGGTFTSSVLSDGQWWRLFTAPLLHGSPLHLAFNCFSLWLAGSLLERLIGWRWFGGIFFLSALGGSASSILVNTSNVVGVGASGGIVGLFAAAIAASFHFQSAKISETIRFRAIQILVPSLLPILSSVKNGEKVDYAAHVGGALVGVLLAVVMMSLWPRQNAYPRFNKSMSVVTIAFVVVAALSILPIVATRSAVVGDPMANYAIGNYQRAAGGFAAKAQAATENAPYYYIWQFLAQTHLEGEKAVAELRLNRMNVDPLKWPMPVIDVFLGDGRVEDLPGKAADNDQRCEATFYTGEWYRLQNDDVHAIANFQESLALCPKTFLEFDGAKAELAHLGVKGAVP
nr:MULTISPECIES: rhomboid family intramembrane serine protease [unclassified Rhizobium]